MRLRFDLLICVALLPVLVACRSNSARFGAVQPPSQPPVKLDEKAFTTVEQTNQIRPEWLKAPTDLFRLGPGDSIEIEMLGESGSRTLALVGPDGKIYYNLLPGVFVWGMTLSETKAALEKELGKLMRVKPEIALALRNVESKRVWLLGSVQRPGVYPLSAPVTVLEAISGAGGTVQMSGSLTGLPDLQRSFLLRRGQMVNVDFQRLLGQGDLTQNVYLQPDDFIYLRPGVSRNVYVLGAVAAPSIVPYSDRVSLLAAIASCGGTLPYARVSTVAIVRGSLVEPRVATVDYDAIRKGKIPDVLLQEGDIVYVSYVVYRRLAMLVDGAVQTFVTTVGYNYGSQIAGGAANIPPSVPGAVVTPPPVIPVK